MQEPQISKDLRDLMNNNLKTYPYGMICTGFLSLSEPYNTVHTTFGGFNNLEDFSNSLSNDSAKSKFQTLCALFANKENLDLMIQLILNGPQNIENKELSMALLDHELIEAQEDKFVISAKGRSFVLATYSIVS